MDGTDKNTSNNENKSTPEEINNTLNDEKRQELSRCNDDAGPSTTLLPGTVQNSKFNQLKPGISKSEHSLRHIITTKDVANALKSISFNTRQPTAKLDVKEFKIPVSLQEENVEDSTSFIDLKKLMASCFKFNKDASNAIILGDVPNIAVPNTQTVRPVISTIINETNATNTIVQTETISAPINTNEVIVTNIIEPKQSKSSKKKVSCLSEKSDLGLAQRDSLSSIGSNVCRICMTKGKERLISPCHCKGSLANVHLSCLERWLNQVGRHHCELCGFSYPAIRTPRYTVLQALRLWFGNPRNRSHLQSDCLIFWLLSTVTAGLLAVCIVGTQYFAIEGSNFGKLDARKEEGISHRITETAMDFFMAIVLCGYSVTVYLLWKDHYVMWNRWRRANVNVRLLLTPDANPVPFLPRSGYTVV